jgi:hypothetical protein
VALLCAAFLVASAHTAQAGIDVWTSHGPEGGNVRALAVYPIMPSMLDAATGRAFQVRYPPRGGRPGLRLQRRDVR